MPPPTGAAAALGITYRPIGEDDLPFLAMVYASTRLEEVAATGWPVEAQRTFLIQQFHAQHTAYMRTYTQAEWLIIERGGEAVGRLYVDDWKDEIRLIDIALLPAGRGNGTGTAILTDLQTWARDSGKALTIHVEQSNPARSLYDRMGFVPIGGQGVYDLLEWRAQAPAR